LGTKVETRIRDELWLNPKVWLQNGQSAAKLLYKQKVQRLESLRLVAPSGAKCITPKLQMMILDEDIVWTAWKHADVS